MPAALIVETKETSPRNKFKFSSIFVDSCYLAKSNVWIFPRHHQNGVWILYCIEHFRVNLNLSELLPVVKWRHIEHHNISIACIEYLCFYEAGGLFGWPLFQYEDHFSYIGFPLYRSSGNFYTGKTSSYIETTPWCWRYADLELKRLECCILLSE